MAMLARTPAEVVAGEAVSGSMQERFNDMLHVASVMYNRSLSTGTPMADIVSAINPANNNKEFDAFGKALPPGTRSLVGLAQQAINEVQQYGPVTDATFYATPKAVTGLPDNLKFETATVGHRYFSDPLNRSFNTANGFKVPDPTKLGMQAKLATTTTEPASSIDPAFTANGMLAGNPVSTLPSTTSQPASNGWQEMAAAGKLDGKFATVADRMGLPGPTSGESQISSGIPTTASIADRMGVPISSFPMMASAPPIKAPLDVNAVLGAMTGPKLAAKAGVPLMTPLFQPAPLKQPAVNSFAELAAAPPMALPVDASISAQLGLTPGLEAAAVPSMKTPTLNNFADLAAAGPMAVPVNASVSAQLGLPAGLEAQTAVPTAKTPTLDNFSDLANAGPIQAPEASGIRSPEMQQRIASVTQQLEHMKPLGATATSNSFSDLAAAGPLANTIGMPATADLGLTPGLDATANAAAITPANFNERFGPVATTDVAAKVAAPATQPGIPNSVISDFVNEQAANKVVDQFAATAVPSVNDSLSAPTALSSMLASPSIPAMASNSLISAPASIQSIVSPSMVPNASIPSVNAPSFASPIAEDPNVSLDAPATNIANDPAVSMPSLQTITVPNQPKVAPVSYTAPASQSLTDATRSITQAVAPQKTAMDVWNGLATTGIATDGSTVTKMEDGTIGRYNPAFNHTEYTNADGSYGGLKKGNTLSGLTAPSLTSGVKAPTPTDPNSSLSRMSNSIFSAGTLGSLAGAALGTALAGPIGGLALGMIGQKLGGKYLGDQVPDESPMHALLGLFTGNPSITASNPLGQSVTSSTEPGGGGGVTGTPTGPTGGGYSSPGLF